MNMPKNQKKCKNFQKHRSSTTKSKEIESKNRQITSSKIELVMKNQQTEVQEWKDSQDNSLIYKEELIPILLKLLQKIEDEGRLPNSFSKSTITLIHKLIRDTPKILQTYTFDEYSCKNPQQNISKHNSTKYKKNHTARSSGIYFREAKMI